MTNKYNLSHLSFGIYKFIIWKRHVLPNLLCIFVPCELEKNIFWGDLNYESVVGLGYNWLFLDVISWRLIGDALYLMFMTKVAMPQFENPPTFSF